MTWNAPTSRSTGELITAAIWNADIVDNLLALKSPPGTNYVADESSNYTTTSTSFTEVDATNLALTMTTTGGAVFVGFHGVLTVSTHPMTVFFNVDQDGSPVAADDGIMLITSFTTGTVHPVSFVRQISAPAAGSHTYKLQWKVNTGTGTLYAGAGTSTRDLHPQFWVRELT